MIRGHMATYPARAANLKVTLDLITPQLDRLFLCLNEYDTVPDFLSDYDNVEPYLPEADLKDTGKFVFQAAPEDEVFLLDDDLRYASNYVEHMRAILPGAIDQNAVLGVYGLIMKEKFHRRGFKRHYYKMRKPLPESIFVDYVGTGTLYARGCNLPPFDVMHDSKRFTDIRYARWCHENGISHICVARKYGLIKPQETVESIYADFTRELPAAVFDEVKAFGRQNPHLGHPVENILTLPGQPLDSVGERKGH